MTIDLPTFTEMEDLLNDCPKSDYDKPKRLVAFNTKYGLVYFVAREK